jgi:hypothetical protein
MKLVIRKTHTDTFLFGNKTFTLAKDYARIFESVAEAENHIEQWLNPASVLVENFEEE